MSESETEIELVIDARAVIGKSPLWTEGQSELYWVDIKAPALYRTKDSHSRNDIVVFALRHRRLRFDVRRRHRCPTERNIRFGFFQR